MSDLRDLRLDLERVANRASYAAAHSDVPEAIDPCSMVLELCAIVDELITKASEGTGEPDETDDH